MTLEEVKNAVLDRYMEDDLPIRGSRSIAAWVEWLWRRRKLVRPADKEGGKS